MKAKQEFQRFLDAQRINFDLPERLHAKEDINEQAFLYLHQVCQNLVAAKPVLLRPGNVKNLQTLIKLANCIGQSGLQRLKIFADTICWLSEDATHPTLITQDSFDAICCVTRSKLVQHDIKRLAQCFEKLQNFKLLTKENIKKVVDRLLRIKIQQSMASIPQLDPDCAEELLQWLSDRQALSQNDFDLMMRTRQKVSSIAVYMQKLQDVRLKNPKNCQAMVDAAISLSKLRPARLPNTQPALNTIFFASCKVKLKQLNSAVGRFRTKAPEIHQHASALYHRLERLSRTSQAEADPHRLLRALTVVLKALPTNNQNPDSADIEELIALGEEAEGHPSPVLQTIGKLIMLLGATIAIAIGVTLSVATIGPATPVGIGLVATGIAGGVSSLAGYGLFAFGKSRSGMSKDMVNLAREVEEFQLPIQSGINV